MSFLSFFRGFFIDEMGCWRNSYYILLAHPQHIKVRSTIEKAVGQLGLILDVGSRKSPYTRRLKGHVTYLDKPTESSGYLGFASDMVAKMSKLPNREVVLGDALALPFADRTYDVVLCIEVIEHIDNDEKALFEIARVMKPNSWGFFTTPNADVMSNLNPYHVRHYSPKDFLEKLEKHFSEVRLQTICPWPKWYNLLYKLLRDFDIGSLFLYSILRTAYLLLDLMIPRCLSGSGAVIVAQVAEPKIHNVATKH